MLSPLQMRFEIFFVIVFHVYDLRDLLHASRSDYLVTTKVGPRTIFPCTPHVRLAHVTANAVPRSRTHSHNDLNTSLLLLPLSITPWENMRCFHPRAYPFTNLTFIRSIMVTSINAYV